ncbi:hypothetical protein BJV82DRAFT_581268 [Fennellomyces sp. T-0311]|nr:hypothetical protein BJV82DRAFT_581268 [Fennellomyces sp. T-0311]
MWNKRVNAPSTIFTARNSMSPRQVASKAYSLACKKLDRDERRRRPSYDVRERVLLYNTMNKADNVLNKPKARTNRRVLAAEDDEVGYDDPPQCNQHHQHYPPHHHSPLALVSMTDEEDQPEDQEIQASLPQSQQSPVTTVSPPPQPEVSSSQPTPMAIEPSIPSEEVSLPEIAESSLASVPPAPPSVPLVATVQVHPPFLPLSLLPNPPTTASSSIIPLDLPALECRIALSHSSYRFTCTPPVIV